MHIFFYEAFEEEQAAIKKYCPVDITAGYSRKTIQECGHTEPPAPLISLRTQSYIPPGWAGHLQGILSRSAGYDHLLRYHEFDQVPRGYLPEYCVRAVAEQALTLWMALLRRLPEQLAHLARFDRDHLTGRESAGRTLAVFGVGRIGHEIAVIGKALGMTVLGVDVVCRHDDIRYVTPDEALRAADVIVCAMNLTDKNHGYFHYDVLAAARPDAVFVNVARGELAPARDLLRLLEAGRLGGVGLDVYDREGEMATLMRRAAGMGTPDPEFKAVQRLMDHPRAMLTPHNAFNTVEAVEKKAEQSIQQVVQFLHTGRFVWPIPAENAV